MKPISATTVRTIELAVRCYVAGRAGATSDTPDVFWMACKSDVLAFMSPRWRTERLPEAIEAVVHALRAEMT